jgi:hypothetical protein
MTEALTIAGARPEVDASEDVLKVFVAPEFYFRSPLGAYTDLEYFTGAVDKNDPSKRDRNSIVGGLAEAVKDPKWKDWLFVFGTAVVIAAPFTTQDYLEQSGWTKFLELLNPWRNKKAFLNIAMVQKGGFADENERIAKCVIVIKEHMSTIDWLKIGTVVLTPKQVAHFPAVGPGNYELEVNTPGQFGSGGANGGSIFMLDNITYGLEVCLDHATGRLRRAAPKSGDFFVQIQLIPSGGMTIKADKVATLQEGLVFNVDGLSSAKAATPLEGVRGYHSQLFSVQSVGQPATLADMNEIQRSNPGTVAANLNLAAVKEVFWLPPDNNAKTPDIWVPDLVFYETVNVPSSAVANV